MQESDFEALLDKLRSALTVESQQEAFTAS